MESPCASGDKSATMIFDSATEKAAIISKPITRSSIEENAEIKNTKRSLVLSISIELFIMVIYLLLQMVILMCKEIGSGNVRSGIFVESFITLISIGYLIGFIIAITRYFPAGLVIFAWLTLIQLIGGSILLILAIMGVILSLSIIHSVGAEIIVDIIFTIIGISIIVLSVFIILYLLNLLKSRKK